MTLHLHEEPRGAGPGRERSREGRQQQVVDLCAVGRRRLLQQRLRFCRAEGQGDIVCGAVGVAAARVVHRQRRDRLCGQFAPIGGLGQQRR